VVLSNRRTALHGLSEADLAHLRTSLEQIAANCTPTPK